MDSFESRNDFSDAQSGVEGTDEQVQASATRRDLVLQPDANGVVVLPEGAHPRFESKRRLRVRLPQVPPGLLDAMEASRG